MGKLQAIWSTIWPILKPILIANWKPVAKAIYISGVRPLLEKLVEDDSPETDDWNDILFEKVDEAIMKLFA